MSQIPPLHLLAPQRFETPLVLKKLATATRRLAELKGVAMATPNQSILINTLGMQEAKDSSAIENIVTTHDELFKHDFPDLMDKPAAKEVMRYRQALKAGYDSVRRNGLMTINDIINVQSILEQNTAGFRKLPGTTLMDAAGRIVYTPPQDHATILRLMAELESFINDDTIFDADPLIKLALLHHQFESIHPFYDGNGRTGRILNVLYLVQQKLLDIPVLYLSRYIVRTKSDYYRLLQKVRQQDAWEEWVFYMLSAVEYTAGDAVTTVHAIQRALLNAKQQIRSRHKFYSQDLINNLFNHPYTKVDYVMRDLNVSRITATRYLKELAADGFLKIFKIGNHNYYVNVALNVILTGESMQGD